MTSSWFPTTSVSVHPSGNACRRKRFDQYPGRELRANHRFYSPRLLARDIATVDRLTDGRVEIGLGAGYVQQEYEAARVPFLSAAGRVQQLADAVGAVRDLLSSSHHWPRPIQSTVPIMIAGKGDKILKIAA
ncbi:LLM class flavin-dependent oxidoreductase [Mycobacteroides salmoniphilum]|uniref:LLM class flavin-dependent oxidoreductase n=1 Tax=Mycobacteroides salmoniphilum TaxID=404941 RepID=UPI001AD815B1|nr:LLM class flavin-dependent oxidoreductase [Mycobacteroides salmoniphilum]